MPDSYALVDCGGGRRLERFGSALVARPAPAAATPPGLPGGAWRPDVEFRPGEGWRGAPPGGWRVRFGPALLAPRCGAGGGLGVFPEHARVADRLDSLLAADPPGSRAALNLFAHTGLATLRLAALPQLREVVHVDAASAAVAQARDNARLSGLAEASVRWLVDDALAFLRRERRRERRYDLVLADPPAFGRSGKKDWRLDRDLPALLTAAAEVLASGGTFVFTCHSEGWGEGEVAAAVAESRRFAAPEVFSLALEAESGRVLPAGWCALAEAE